MTWASPPSLEVQILEHFVDCGAVSVATWRECFESLTVVTDEAHRPARLSAREWLAARKRYLEDSRAPCPGCGAKVTRSAPVRGKIPVYCSKACLSRAKTRAFADRHRDKVLAASRDRRRAKAEAERAARPPRICQCCHLAPVSGKRADGKYCSNACRCKASYRARRQA